MIRMIIAGCLVGLMLAAGAAAQQPKDSEIDFKRAKMLLDKERKGEKLTKEEQAYLEKAKEAIRQRNQPGQAQGPARGGKDSTGLVPLNDLGHCVWAGSSAAWALTSATGLNALLALFLRSATRLGARPA